jgi:hypothetical protein
MKFNVKKISLIVTFLALSSSNCFSQYFYSPNEDLNDFSAYPYYTEGHIQKYEKLISPFDKANPTDVGNYENVKKIFDILPAAEGNSDCFMRAYAWTYEAWNRLYFNPTTNEIIDTKAKGIISADFKKIELKKILIFYTRLFRENLNNKWGFHIAPSVVAGGVTYILDKQYLAKPATAKEWVDKLNNSGSQSEFVRLKNLQKSLLATYHNFEEKPKKVAKAKLALSQIMRVSLDHPQFEQLIKKPVEPINCPWIKHRQQFFDWSAKDFCYLLEATMHTSGPSLLRDFETCTLEGKGDNCPTSFFYNWDNEYLFTARKKAFKNFEKIWPEMAPMTN